MDFKTYWHQQGRREALTLASAGEVPIDRAELLICHGWMARGEIDRVEDKRLGRAVRYLEGASRRSGGYTGPRLNELVETWRNGNVSDVVTDILEGADAQDCALRAVLFSAALGAEASRVQGPEYACEELGRLARLIALRS